MPGVEVLTPRFFNEIAVRLPKPAARWSRPWPANGVLAGVPYAASAPEAGLDDVLLVAATETTTDDDIDLARALAKALTRGAGQ